MSRAETMGELVGKLAECSNDELLLVLDLVGRITKGRAQYGAWDKEKELRNFSQEKHEEVLDWLVYDAMARVSGRT